MQILFFHGLQLVDYPDAHVLTWKSEDYYVIWPQKWLVEDFPGAQIFTISYNEGVANLDMFLVGENLTPDLIEGEIGQVPGCPVIMVGYCVGGLVTKEICLQAKKQFHSGKTSTIAKEKLGMFLENVRGIFFYGTPHRGSSLIDNVPDGPLFEYLKVLNKDAARLNEFFDDFRVLYPNWKVHGLGESLPTNAGNVVVPEAAARYGHEFWIVNADHDTICRPRNKVDKRFYALRNLIDSIIKNLEEVQEKAGVHETRPQNIQPLPDEIVLSMLKCTQSWSSGIMLGN
ncbi:unnamed protein product [Calypogeia fissa]